MIMVFGPIACVRVICVPSRKHTLIFTAILILPAIIYNFILAFFCYNTDTDWMKKEEAKLKSVTELYRACIDEQYSQTLQFVELSQASKIEEYEARNKLYS